MIIRLSEYFRNFLAILIISSFQISLGFSSECLKADAALDLAQFEPPKWKETISQFNAEMKQLKALLRDQADLYDLMVSLLKSDESDIELLEEAFGPGSMDRIKKLLAYKQKLAIDSSLTRARSIIQPEPGVISRSPQIDEEFVALVENYIDLMGLGYKTIRSKKSVVFEPKADENGNPVQRLQHYIQSNFGYRLVIDSNTQKLGYVETSRKVMHMGLQVIFATDFRTGIFLHEMNHLEAIAYASRIFSLFGASIFSKKKTPSMSLIMKNMRMPLSLLHTL